MSYTLIDGDVHVNGSLTAKTLTPPAASVTDASIVAGAGVQATKLQHQNFHEYAQDSSTVATVERRVIHTVYGATATLVKFSVGCVTIATGTGSAVIDLLKNGVSILSATITLDSANTNYILEDAPGYTSTALVAGDVLEFKVVSAAVGSGTKPIGVFCRAVTREDAA